MEIWRSLEEVPRDVPPTVVTIGNFDGVHRGHQAVLRRMVEDARERGQRAVAITFEPHPLRVHYPERPLQLIAGIQDRLEWLAETGLDGLLLIEYTVEFAQQSPAEFVEAYLVDGLGVATVVVGGDIRFGKDNVGHLDTMRELGGQHGFDVEVIGDVGGVEAGERAWSSTRARAAIEAGDMGAAREILGRDHRVRGVVVHGDALGREIGFPTANLDVTAGMIPGHGVYAGWLTVVDAAGGPEGAASESAAAVQGIRMPVAVSVGINYTVGGQTVRVEAHIIDRDGLDLYGAVVALDFHEWRRPMRDFGGLPALIEALGEDVEWCRSILGMPTR